MFILSLLVVLIFSVIKLGFVIFLNLTVCTKLIEFEKLGLILEYCTSKLNLLINRSI